MSAQALFTRMLVDEIGPVLRGEGCTGSGQTYRLRDPNGHHALLGFQKDRFNTADRCRFTINLTVYRQEEWEAARRTVPWLPARPTTSTVFPGTEGWYQRIGFLGAEPHDHWWLITDPADVPAVTADLLRAIRGEALPAMRAVLNGERSRDIQGHAFTDATCPWPGCEDWFEPHPAENWPEHSARPDEPARIEPADIARLIQVRVGADAAARLIDVGRRTLRDASRYAGLPADHDYSFGELVALAALPGAHSPRRGEHLPRDVYQKAFNAVRAACADGLPAPDSRLIVHGTQATVSTDMRALRDNEPVFPDDAWWPTFETDLSGFAHAVAIRQRRLADHHHRARRERQHRP